MSSDSTCTVTFDNSITSGDCKILYAIVSIIESGTLKNIYIYVNDNNNEQVTIQNIICGTDMIIVCQRYMKNDTTYPYLEIDGSAIFESWEEVGNIAYDS